ncbi:hypothetical protein HK101_004565 [Irineochytrium annulatum]|nr:hypothetical protein HK101_004565 [Irineochytrium annulatum]
MPATDREGTIKFPKLTSSTYANPDAYVTWLTNVWNHVSSIPLPDKYRYRIIERIVGRDPKTKKDKILMIPITDLVTHLEQIVPEPTLEGIFPNQADNLAEINDANIEEWATLHAGWSQAEAKITTLIAAHLDHDLGLIFAQGNGFVYDKLAHLQRHVKYRKTDAITDLLDQINRVRQGPTETSTAYAKKVSMFIHRLRQAGYPSQNSPTVAAEFKLDVATKFIRGMRPELRATLKTVFDAKETSSSFDHLKEYLEDAELEEARSALQRGDEPATPSGRVFTADGHTTSMAQPTLESLMTAVSDLKIENAALQRVLSGISQDNRRGTGSNNGSTKELNLNAVFVKGFPDGTTEAELAAHFQPDATARIFRMFRGGRAAIIDLKTTVGGARGLITSKSFKGVELTIEQANKRFSNYSSRTSLLASDPRARSTGFTSPTAAPQLATNIAPVSGLLDSACTKSLTPTADILTNTSVSSPSSFLGVSGTVITGSGTHGDIHGSTNNGHPILINNVEHVPGAS